MIKHIKDYSIFKDEKHLATSSTKKGASGLNEDIKTLLHNYGVIEVYKRIVVETGLTKEEAKRLALKKNKA